MSGEVLAIQDSSTDAGATPVPESEIVAGEFVALLVTVTVPLTLPGVAGSKVTTERRGLIWCERGSRAHAARAEAEPVAFTPEMVWFAFPLFVTMTLSELVVPSFTLPKLKLVGLAPISMLDASRCQPKQS